jgi:hypothetical protein
MLRVIIVALEVGKGVSLVNAQLVISNTSILKSVSTLIAMLVSLSTVALPIWNPWEVSL